MTTNPRQSNPKRLTAFKRFYDGATCDKELRIACLCLRLSSVAVAMPAKKQKLPEDGGDSTPTFVRMGRGDVSARTRELSVNMVPLLPADPGVPLGEAVPALLVTQGHIELRFAEYMEEYPGLLWTLTKKYNEAGYVVACERFLATDCSQLGT